jgi:mannan endo-1,4-beta-mannosidase
VRKAVTIAAGVVVLIAVAFATYDFTGLRHSGPSHPRDPFALPASPDSYIGLYLRGVPESYAGVKAFANTTGVKPGVVVYYSGWLEPFQTSFATTTANDGAVPLVQINPVNVSIAAIASGKYDGYLRTYAKAVRAFRHPVIISFGHEMNGYWYSWGYTHTSPAVFVDAWRHIVTLFRALGTRNVTWLWTINTIHPNAGGPSPAAWWPGSSYVTWIGMDGYYLNSPSVFASVFGPTIGAVRAFTHEPILIAETAATPAAGQPAKIADLFAGTRLYGLLGFVWFDTAGDVDWRLNTSAAITALRRGARTYRHAP